MDSPSGAQAVLPAAAKRPVIEQVVRFSGPLLSLAKPGLVFFLLLSAVSTAVVAAGEALNSSLVLWLLLGGALLAGSANAANCIVDRDIDALMERTKHRPLASGKLSVRAAVLFSVSTGSAGLLVIACGISPLAAAIGICGLFVYVFLYTLCLKRRTPHSVVWGGLASAMPPLIGWAGAAGQLEVSAIFFALTMFFWTPPHSWALALVRQAEYAHAGVPMLPVTHGEARTCGWIMFYALLLAASSTLYGISRPDGGALVLFLILLNLVFLRQTWMLKKSRAKQETAQIVFRLSLYYLVFFFAGAISDSLFSAAESSLTQSSSVPVHMARMLNSASISKILVL
ncbi:MAG TPA: heme o synthase [Oligoflexia bacterium]|nr:heme o synthase [Oligoflexia bacterium]